MDCRPTVLPSTFLLAENIVGEECFRRLRDRSVGKSGDLSSADKPDQIVKFSAREHAGLCSKTSGGRTRSENQWERRSNSASRIDVLRLICALDMWFGLTLEIAAFSGAA